ncbi:hypothetical protein Y032_0037g3506 [Ancylostoma ceylanicum]|uniref:Sema domain-containing protein n=1 Tax=Ancylostoma ceylanicum TaxID=53326 RepID=A0A016UJ57_9BILA|nr:hypothetical protein Y032_0037g3506 [Ancylostoma ceylanicum]
MMSQKDYHSHCRIRLLCRQQGVGGPSAFKQRAELTASRGERSRVGGAGMAFISWQRTGGGDVLCSYSV